jgi:hypothetical protein
MLIVMSRVIQLWKNKVLLPVALPKATGGGGRKTFEAGWMTRGMTDWIAIGTNQGKSERVGHVPRKYWNEFLS